MGVGASSVMIGASGAGGGPVAATLAACNELTPLAPLTLLGRCAISADTQR